MKQWILLLGILFPMIGNAQMPKILDLKTQGQVTDKWLKERVESLLPDLMRIEKIDMWVLLSREYNEDPVLKTLN